MAMNTFDPMQGCSHYAFRLEALPTYRGTTTDEYVADYLRNGHAPANSEWVASVNALRGRGVRVMRLRLLSDPLTPYEEYELRAGYRAGLDAGEEIRTLPRTSVRPSTEFWLYDDEWIEELDYDELGAFVSSRVRAVLEADKPVLQYWLDRFEEAVAVT